MEEQENNQAESKTQPTRKTYAVIKATGRSHTVCEGQKLTLEYSGTESALPETLTFDQVMLGSQENSDKAIIGTPYISGASVTAKVLNSQQGKKLIAFKRKRRQGFRKKKGSRSQLVEVEISNISLP